MTPRNGQSIFARDLAFKSVEIEELTDVYFFRPAGLLIARAARAIGITPTGLTVIGTLIGMTAGVLFYQERLALLGFALLMMHSIIDSADGQLARLTGRVTELGRALDGLSGYATHVAIYVALASGFIHRGAGPTIFLWMAMAGISTAMHASMYDYYRHAYIAVVNAGRVPAHSSPHMPPPVGWLFRIYLTVQRGLTGPHSKVESALATRATALHVSEPDRALYRQCFYPVVRGWNFLGDNTRFFALGVLAALLRLDLFFLFVLGPMNIAFLLLWFWQRNADRNFLGRA